MKKIALIIASLAVFPSVAFAQLVAPIETAAKQAYLIDTNTGTVLYAKDADAQMPTSSMSKMMTVYLVFEAIRNHGDVTPEDLAATVMRDNPLKTRIVNGRDN